jgi:hypothetical protein
MFFLLGFAAISSAHFVLQVPTSLGFDDVKEDIAPCGGFDIAADKVVTDWPLSGGHIQVISTHVKAKWDIRAALLSDVANFTDMLPTIAQEGLGTFCLPTVPGIAAWKGKEAVLQIIQTATDGKLYQVSCSNPSHSILYTSTRQNPEEKQGRSDE